MRRASGWAGAVVGVVLAVALDATGAAGQSGRLGSAGTAEARPTAGMRSLAELGFVAGCWREGASAGNGLEEMHMAPAENLMLGVSRLMRGGRAVEHEFLRVEQTPEGPILRPHPNGVASVAFRLAELTAERVVWSNPEHDFPHRIIYHRASPDTLVARIEGDSPQGVRSREWRMGRVRCPGS